MERGGGYAYLDASGFDCRPPNKRGGPDHDLVKFQGHRNWRIYVDDWDVVITGPDSVMDNVTPYNLPIYLPGFDVEKAVLEIIDYIISTDQNPLYA